MSIGFGIYGIGKRGEGSTCINKRVTIRTLVAYKQTKEERETTESRKTERENTTYWNRFGNKLTYFKRIGHVKNMLKGTANVLPPRRV